MTRPLILITNDDGIYSLGLQAAVHACAGLGDLLIVAPIAQQTASGRSKPNTSTGRLTRVEFALDEGSVWGYGVDGTPAQAVEHALFELTPRPIDLAVSGINYGENIGEGITVSGTVGAALEAASFAIPALAVSRQTSPEHYYNHLAEVDFAVAGHFVRRFAALTLRQGLPPGAHVLKIDVPEEATPETPCRWTRLSLRRYFYPVAPQRTSPDGDGPLGFTIRVDAEQVEPGSDVHAVVVEKAVSITPISRDMTAQVPGEVLRTWCAGGTPGA